MAQINDFRLAIRLWLDDFSRFWEAHRLRGHSSTGIRCWRRPAETTGPVFDQNGLNPVDAAQVDTDVSESLFLLSAPSGGGIHPPFPRRVIASLEGSVEHAVRNLAGSDVDGPDDSVLRVADALERNFRALSRS